MYSTDRMFLSDKPVHTLTSRPPIPPRKQILPATLNGQMRTSGIGYKDVRGKSCTAVFVYCAQPHLKGHVRVFGDTIHWIDAKGDRWMAPRNHDNQQALVAANYYYSSDIILPTREQIELMRTRHLMP